MVSFKHPRPNLTSFFILKTTQYPITCTIKVFNRLFHLEYSPSSLSVIVRNEAERLLVSELDLFRGRRVFKKHPANVPLLLLRCLSPCDFLFGRGVHSPDFHFFSSHSVLVVQAWITFLECFHLNRVLPDRYKLGRLVCICDELDQLVELLVPVGCD